MKPQLINITVNLQDDEVNGIPVRKLLIGILTYLAADLIKRGLIRIRGLTHRDENFVYFRGDFRNASVDTIEFWIKNRLKGFDFTLPTIDEATLENMVPSEYAVLMGLIIGNQNNETGENADDTTTR